MNAEEIAEKYNGQIVECKCSKTPTISGMPVGSAFKAKIVGFKYSQMMPKKPLFVLVSPISYSGNGLLSSSFYANGSDRADYVFKIYDAILKIKKVYPSEITLPDGSKGASLGSAKPSKIISEYPHICKDCKSPAWISMSLIDCSNPSCGNKYKSKSSQDLFLPVEIRSQKSEK